MLRPKKRKYDDPLRHAGHPRPRTRRQFLSQGFIAGAATTLGGASITIGSGRDAHAAFLDLSLIHI